MTIPQGPLPAGNPMFPHSLFPNALDTINDAPDSVADAIGALQSCLMGLPGAAPMPPPPAQRGSLLFSPDNTYDIGANGANRPRNVYVGGSVIVNNNVNANQLQGFNASLAQGIQIGLGASPVNWLFGGSGAPPVGLGSNGDYFFRQDTPATANQRIYVKSAGAWTGIV